jgi:hypothetical protein
MNGISGMGGAAVRLRESIQVRLRAGQTDRLTQAAVGIVAGGSTAAGAADPAGVRHGEHRGVADPAGVAGATGTAGAGGADPAGVAAARGHREAGELEDRDEAHEAGEVEHHGARHAEGRGEDEPHHLGRLEVAIGAPGEVADPAGIAQATAVRGAAAYQRTREAAEVGAASPGISVAA